MEPMFVSRTATLGMTSLAAALILASLSACTSGSASPEPAGGTVATSAAAPGAATSGGAASVAGSAAAAGSSAIVPQASALHWQACGGQLAGLRCASLQVPLNYADPGGKKITIALYMVPATAPPARQQGVMLVSPGGPGAPGRSLAADVAARISPQVAATYDIV